MSQFNFAKATPGEFLLPPRRRYVAVTLGAAFILNLAPLPEVLQLIRPDLVALTLLYWAIAHTRKLGLFPAWLLGLFMDVADGTLFGQHALAYSVLIFLAIFFRRRVLMFGMRYQMLHVLAMLLAAQLAMLLVRSMAGAEFPGLWYFVGSFLGAALWPVVLVVVTVPLRPKVDPNAV